MNMAREGWRKWEGRVIDEKFPLRKWLGGSEQSAVFLTERGGGGKAAIKLIGAEMSDEKVQLSRWDAAAKFSHPHVTRLFESGKCAVDGTPLLYVVMEYADETLAEILPVRALSATEATEMLAPAGEALSALHRAGLAHGSMKPSNVLAAENHVKLSGDSVGKIGERGRRAVSAYDAPEISATGPSPAADMWALGATLVAVLTQRGPRGKVETKGGGVGSSAVPSTIPQPLRRIAEECLREDPAQRCTAQSVVGRLRPAAAASSKSVEPNARQERPKRWYIVPIVAAVLFLVALVGSRMLSKRSATSPAQTEAVAGQKPVEIPAPPAAPAGEQPKPGLHGVERGGVVQQVMPDVSRGAQSTIIGHVKVSVQVAVDAAGNVSATKLVSPGPSHYFAGHALAAAQRWKFTPARVDGKATASEWLLRFQFGRSSMQVLPSEIKP